MGNFISHGIADEYHTEMNNMKKQFIKKHLFILALLSVLLYMTACSRGSGMPSAASPEAVNETVTEDNTETVTETAEDGRAEDTTEESGIPEQAGMIGSWEDTESGFDETFVFNSDNTGSYSIMKNVSAFTYTLEGNKLTILYGDGTNVEYTVSYNEKYLTMTDSFKNLITCERKE